MNKLTSALLFLAFFQNGFAQTQPSVKSSKVFNRFFEKKLVFPKGATDQDKILFATRVVPTEQQLNWQKQELTAFIHFGMNTFTGREWGDGKEDPKLFNPTNFDAEQWVKSLKDAGFKMLILTAKHHDGFCLWPTKTTTHSVASSLWKDGKGDVVKEVKAACDKLGMNFGVYLSPWDRNAASYGDSPKYNDMFVAQLTELLTQYGEIHEVWFDGANAEGPNGKTQVYDWPRFYKVIEKLQPKAVKAIMGDDIRWVGNESGLGRATEWSVTPLYPDINAEVIADQKRLGISATSKDLGSDSLIVKANSLHWYPSEVDVSIRPGWFYHPEQDAQVKTLQQLVDIYNQSVGMNSVLLLNIPPDKRGLIHEVDVARLKDFGSYLKKTFSNNILKTKFKPWSVENTQSIELDTKGKLLNTILVQEDISKGQRVEAFEVNGLVDGVWKKLGVGTTIGYKRILKLDDVNPSKIRLTILKTRATAHLSNLELYYAAPIKTENFGVNLNDFSTSKWTVIGHEPLVVDLNEEITAKGFSYKPEVGKESVFKYTFSGSRDGKSWEVLSEGEFSNIKNNPIPQIIKWDKNHTFQYFKFENIEGAEGGKPSSTASQIGILK